MVEVNERQERETTTVILIESGYGILQIPRNYVVARLKDSTASMEANRSNFDESTYDYYPDLRQALVGLSNRLLANKLKKNCKDKALQLQEVANILKEHHNYLKDILAQRVLKCR